MLWCGLWRQYLEHWALPNSDAPAGLFRAGKEFMGEDPDEAE